MTNGTFKSGIDRQQACVLPARVEDYVGPDNPVRAIESYVSSLDLVKLGFRHAGRGTTVGQPPYDPADLLKLYLYGYLNRVRSSRGLQREACRNLEVIWLLQGLTPGYRTIGTFRQENWAALKAANRDFVLLARALDLVSGTFVAIDGAFFHGDAGKASIATSKKLREQIAALERDIEAYRAALDSNDAAEAAAPGGADRGGDGTDIGQKVAALMAKRARAQVDLDRLEASGETQVSRTDADARLLSKSGQTVAGYNVQVAVDDKHKLIVASAVTNDGNDTGQLYEMAKAAKEAVGAETKQVVADVGYYNGATLKACEDDGMVAYVPSAKRSGRLQKQGRYSHEDFSYDAALDAYHCPAGALLQPTAGRKTNTGGRIEIRYVSRKASCDACPLRGGCVTEKAPTRTLFEETRHPYTEALLKSIPKLAQPSHTRLEAIAGRPPDLVRPPKGCKFAPRCPYAQPKCLEKEPELADPETPGHFFRCFYPTGTDAGREALERNVAAGENACGMPVRQQGEIVSTGVIG